MLLVEARPKLAEERKFDPPLVTAVPVAAPPVVGEGLGDNHRTFVPQIRHHVAGANIEALTFLLAARDRNVWPTGVRRGQDARVRDHFDEPVDTSSTPCLLVG